MKRIIVFLLALLPVFAHTFAAKTDVETVVLRCDLHCQGCCDKIMKNISWEKGVKDIVCDLKTKTVTVKFDTRKTTLDKLLEAFERIGKPATVVKPKEETENERKKDI